jgi:twitching motility protein PilT
MSTLDWRGWLASCLKYGFSKGAKDIKISIGTPPRADLGRAKDVNMSQDPVPAGDFFVFTLEILGMEHEEDLKAGAVAQLVTDSDTYAVSLSQDDEKKWTLCIQPLDALDDFQRAALEGGGQSGGLLPLLREMLSSGASDLHLSAGDYAMLRIDGEIVKHPSQSKLSHEDVMEIMGEIMPDRNREQFDKTGDTDFAHQLGETCRFRVNMYMDRKGAGVVFRTIPTDILSFQDLNLPDSIGKLCKLKQGLVLVTGQTGSGKSTTLAAMVDNINETQAKHILTLEDPIEFVHENKRSLVNQREIGVHSAGFKEALRAALREDPDIILVGELRDLETIEIAIETAQTGHLVFGTLHTNTAVSTVDRLIDQFPVDRQNQIRVMLAESLKGVISQVLLRKKGKGRVAALEIMLHSRALSNLIREGKSFQIPSLMQTKKSEGNQMQQDALTELVRSGQVDPKEAISKAADPEGAESEFLRLGLM